jgi:hypothetical protein
MMLWWYRMSQLLCRVLPVLVRVEEDEVQALHGQETPHQQRLKGELPCYPTTSVFTLLHYLPM